MGRSYAVVVRKILLGVLAAVLAVGFVGLGLWQIDRHHQRQVMNRAVESTYTAEPVPLGDVSQAGAVSESDVEYRQVTVSGVYNPAGQVLVRNRTEDGRAGLYVLTPLRTSQGSVVYVARGWVPPAEGGAQNAPTVPDVPDGQVQVTGRVRLPENPGGDTRQGEYRSVSRINPQQLAGQEKTHTHGVYVELVEQSPPIGEGFVLISAPQVELGPHLSYAVQWFLFAGAALGGYGWYVWQSRRRAAQLSTA